MKQLFVLLALLFGCSELLNAQVNNLTVSTMSESMAFPFTRYSVIHPGVEFGTEIHQQEKRVAMQSVKVYAGFYFHRKMQNSFYVRLEWGWSIKLSKSIATNLYSGLGYMHVFYPGEIYKPNQSPGEFEKIQQWGKPRALGTLGFGFSYKNQSRFEPFIRQDLGIETPFANGIPVMVHSFLKVGSNIKLEN